MVTLFVAPDGLADGTCGCGCCCCCLQKATKVAVFTGNEQRAASARAAAVESKLLPSGNCSTVWKYERVKPVMKIKQWSLLDLRSTSSHQQTPLNLHWLQAAERGRSGVHSVSAFTGRCLPINSVWIELWTLNRVSVQMGARRQGRRQRMKTSVSAVE